MLSYGDLLVFTLEFSVSALYGEQFIVIQYLPHMSDLIALCKKKFTVNLEGGVIACLALLKHIIAYMADATIAHSLQVIVCVLRICYAYTFKRDTVVYQIYVRIM